MVQKARNILNSIKRTWHLPYVSSANLLYAAAVPALLHLTDAAFTAVNPAYVVSVSGERLLIWFILGLITSLVRPAVLRRLLFTAAFIATLIQYLHFQFYGTYVPPIAIHQFFENLGEVTESFAGARQRMAVPALLVTLMYAATFLLDRMIGPVLRNHAWWAAGIPVLLIIQLYRIFLFSDIPTGKLPDRMAKRLYPIPGLHASENFLRSAGYYAVRIYPRKWQGRRPTFPAPPVPVVELRHPHRTVVLIIGESLRADRLGLLGYPLPTTHRLERIPGLAAKTVYAGGTMTVTSVPVLLNMLRYPGVSSGTSGLFRLARDNGFTTYFMSAQTASQTQLLDGLIDRSNIDVYLNRTGFDKRPGTVSAYDDCLVRMLADVDFTRSSFIVMQQRGSHTPHQKQYPPDYATFKDAYDNTVLYTDYVLASIIEHVRQYAYGERYVLFTSDHGELLGEQGRYGHGWFLEPVYTVPFLYWSPEPVTPSPDRIRCHYDVSVLTARLLGYRIPEEQDTHRTLYVNGSDIDLLAGYMELEMENDSLISYRVVR